MCACECVCVCVRVECVCSHVPAFTSLCLTHTLPPPHHLRCCPAVCEQLNALCQHQFGQGIVLCTTHDGGHNKRKHAAMLATYGNDFFVTDFKGSVVSDVNRSVDPTCDLPDKWHNIPESVCRYAQERLAALRGRVQTQLQAAAQAMSEYAAIKHATVDDLKALARVDEADEADGVGEKDTELPPFLLSSLQARDSSTSPNAAAAAAAGVSGRQRAREAGEEEEEGEAEVPQKKVEQAGRQDRKKQKKNKRKNKKRWKQGQEARYKQRNAQRCGEKSGKQGIEKQSKEQRERPRRDDHRRPERARCLDEQQPQKRSKRHETSQQQPPLLPPSQQVV